MNKHKHQGSIIELEWAQQRLNEAIQYLKQSESIKALRELKLIRLDVNEVIESLEKDGKL